MKSRSTVTVDVVFFFVFFLSFFLSVFFFRFSDFFFSWFSYFSVLALIELNLVSRMAIIRGKVIKSSVALARPGNTLTPLLQSAVIDFDFSHWTSSLFPDMGNRVAIFASRYFSSTFVFYFILFWVSSEFSFPDCMDVRWQVNWTMDNLVCIHWINARSTNSFTN